MSILDIFLVLLGLVVIVYLGSLIVTHWNALSNKMKKIRQNLKVNKSVIALQDLSFLWILSNLPIFATWLLKLTTNGCHKSDKIPPFIPNLISDNCLFQSWGESDLLTYSAAISGSVALVIDKYNNKSKVFPGYKMTMTGILLTIFASGILYAVENSTIRESINYISLNTIVYINYAVILLT